MFQIGRFLSRLAKFASLLGAICVVLMMLHVTGDVIGRYLFNAPLPGTTVIVAHYYMIVLVFIAIGVAEETRAHISVDVFTDLLPDKIRNALSVLSGIITCAVIIILGISGWNEAVKKTSIGATMEQGSQMIDIWQSYWLIPIGAALMVAIAGYRVITQITGWRSGLNETDINAKFIND